MYTRLPVRVCVTRRNFFHGIASVYRTCFADENNIGIPRRNYTRGSFPFRELQLCLIKAIPIRALKSSP